jgi:nucleotide-binding universal stress UspA family protein
MMSQGQRHVEPGQLLVVVGVDGSRAAQQAARWAAIEARLRAATLLIVHVEPVAADILGADRPGHAGEAVLRLSVQAAREVEPEIDVEFVLAAAASVSDELLRISDGAQVIALGIDLTRSRASHGARGPLEDRIAVHANCPVVTVAPLSFLTPGARTQVTVGWTDSRTAELALAVAAEEAHLRGIALTVVTVPLEQDPQLAGIIDPPDHESPLIRSVASVETRYPGLMINISHQTGDVRQALSTMAPSSELLVLGCHHARQPWSIRTGPIAEVVMRTGHCPVMLVGRQAKHPAAGLRPGATAGRHSDSRTPPPEPDR